MLSATVSQGNEVYFWNTMPRSLLGPCTGWLLTRISPESGLSRPAIMRSNVDLPHPEGPSSTRNSPMSRPAAENASSTSRLTSLSALIFSPWGEKKLRETLWTVILDFLASTADRLFAHAGNACGPLRAGLRLSPREEHFLHEREAEAEKEGGHADGDNSGIDQFRLVKFVRRLHHGANAFLAVHDLNQNHVGPANVIEDAEGGK